MIRRLAPLLAAALIAATALAPGVAAADDHRRGGYYGYGDRHGGHYRGHDDRYRGGHRGYDRGYRHHRDDDDDDAIAAGVVGLALGAILGAALIENSQSGRTYAPPPPAYYPPPPPPRYYDGYQSRTCTVRERVWDPYLGQYVRVERRVPC